MHYEVYFPRGIASGEAFCNRTVERKRLISNVNSKQHTLIMSPRRYGKTSLVRYAMNEVGLLYGEADLFVAVDAKQIEQQILNGIQKILGEINTPTEQLLDIIRKYFQKISARWTVGTQGVSIALIPEEKNDPATSIKEALQALDDLLHKKNLCAVFFIDEMQEIGQVAEGKGIEGALRHVAQQTKHLSFCFSGSNRHLLAKMFYDKARPLYKLCDRIILGRIDESHYKTHINKYAQKKWKTKLDDPTINILLDLTQRHPYYVNGLCRHLLESTLTTLPSLEDIKTYWYNMIRDERQELMRELSFLSPGQRKVLVAVANGDNKELTGKNFLRKVNLTGSSVSDALKILEEGDYLEKNENGTYQFIDPLLLSALKLYYMGL
jgi:AAA+ ATPase superfamily predicted ATPase